LVHPQNSLLPCFSHQVNFPDRSFESQRQHLIDEQLHEHKNATGSWAIVEKDIRKIAGAIMLCQLLDEYHVPTQDIEVGWYLKPSVYLERSVWGKGYATEPGRAIVDYGFSKLHLSVIYAVVKPEYYASIRVTERLGMKPLGLTTKYYGIGLLLFQQTASDKIEKIENK
jgi:RimJ/RimL family protein N-acetyltransferase